KGEVVNDFAERGGDLREMFAAVTELLPFPGRGEGGAQTALEEFDLLARVPRLAGALLKLRLIVEQVEVAGGSCHEELDDALGLGRKLWRRGTREQRSEGDAAEAAAGVPEKLASREH